MAAFKEGEKVRIVSRTPTEEDAKLGTYFAHYAGLTGSIQKVYNKQEVAIEVDHESLTKEIRKRHEDVRDQMKTKWLDGLSDEGRSKLTEREKDFNLRYVILVPMADLEKAVAQSASKPAPLPSTQKSQESADSSARKTLADLEAAEEAEFLRRQQS